MPPDLYPFQATGADWLAARKRAFLFDDQGVGKTPTAIGAADRLKAKRNLVLCPSIVLRNWEREVHRFSAAPGRTQVITHGKDKIDPSARWVFCTHARLLSPSMFYEMRKLRWATLIVDEGQAFRNYETKRAQALYGLWGMPGAARLIDRAVYAWVLTGTPMMNDVGDLYPHLYGCFPERIPNETGGPMSYDAFLDRFAVVKEGRYGPSVRGNRNVPEMKRILDGIYLRRMKDEVLPDLPPISISQCVLPAPKSMPWELKALDGRLREALVDKIRADLEDVDDENRIDAALAAFRRHEDFARFRRMSGLLKVEPVSEFVLSLLFPFADFSRKGKRELQHGSITKIVLFAHHTEVIRGIRDNLSTVLAPERIILIDGKTSSTEKDRRIQLFQDDASVAVAICQINAANFGATLTAASEVIFVEQSFNPQVNTQAADRVHRVTQTKPVRIRLITIAGMADEFLVEILRRKMIMIKELFS